MPKFSIIIPVYNVEEYLEECLESIVNQSFKDFEVICVNDGSTDNSLEILQKYAENDERFKVLNQENQGQGIARNNALNIANGEYILFVDPDDFIELNMLEVLNERLDVQNVDVAFFDYQIFGENTKTKIVRFMDEMKNTLNLNINDNFIFNWQELVKDNFRYTAMMVWNKVYSNKFLKENHIQFAPNKHAEDHIFSISATLLANKISYIKKTLYYYRKRSDSSVNKVSENNFCIFENIAIVADFLKQNNLYKKYEHDFRNYIVNLCVYHCNKIPTALLSTYIKKTKQLLSHKEFSTFKKKIKGDFSLLEKLFSIKNLNIPGKTGKYLTILGYTIRL